MIFLYGFIGLILLLGYLLGHFVAAVLVALAVFVTVWLGVMSVLIATAYSDPVKEESRDRPTRQR